MHLWASHFTVKCGVQLCLSFHLQMVSSVQLTILTCLGNRGFTLLCAVGKHLFTGIPSHRGCPAPSALGSTRTVLDFADWETPVSPGHIVESFACTRNIRVFNHCLSEYKQVGMEWRGSSGVEAHLSYKLNHHQKVVGVEQSLVHSVFKIWAPMTLQSI